ncbi:MAG TPA: DUF1549 and DUF1553 domain-containing protein [Pirellulales bacterium]|nr:DUF1549 and DUF1553 domain-containing protein [Pirellulales bacterium]
MLSRLALLSLFLPASPSLADETPATFSIVPFEFALQGARAKQQLLATAGFPEQGEADVTRQATYQSLDQGVALVTAEGLVVPRGDGATTIVAKHGALESRARVVVRDFAEGDPVEFRTDVIAALGRAGCNQGSCHGSPQGKNGFRLSLRGFNPDLDFTTLTHEQGGRRTNVLSPAESLILLKGAGRIAHKGGTRFRETEAAYRTLRTWIGQGCRDTGGQRKLARLEVLPDQRRLHGAHPRQQLVARAHFADGSTRDVSDLAVFTTNHDTALTVTPEGQVEFSRAAEGTVLVRYLDQIAPARLSYVRRDPKYVFVGPPEVNYVDKLVFAKDRDLQLSPAPLATDAVFLRRVYLDAIGTLPTEAEARAFLDSTDRDRRASLIEGLLARNEFAQFWALKWADVMRGNRATVSERGLHSFHRYLVAVFAADRPFDEFARETLTSLGNTLYKPAANFHRVSRTPEEAAETAAQLFLGVRIQCAKCHNHPFEAITQDDYYGLAAYFARVKFKRQQFGLDDEVVYLDRGGEVNHPGRNKPVAPAAFGEPAGELTADDDRRRRLATWLTRPDNRWFSRATVNRIWYHLLGRGLVEPIDDFRDTNPASNADLLDALAEEFSRGGFRVKPIIRVILNSNTYQLSSEPPADVSPEAADAAPYFTRAIVRMLTAEQILDAISSATGLPESFPGYPAGTRAIELAEGGVDHHFLKAFSKPVRDAVCECSREEDPALAQVLHLLNNPAVVAKVKSSDSLLGHWLAAGLETPAIVERMYLATLSRRPTPEEQKLVADHVASLADRAEGLHDLQHALVNSNEFLLRH